jgi:hypothetical protein
LRFSRPLTRSARSSSARFSSFFRGGAHALHNTIRSTVLPHPQSVHTATYGYIVPSNANDLDPALIAAIGAGGALLGAILGSAVKGIADFVLLRQGRNTELKRAARMVSNELETTAIMLPVAQQREPIPTPPPDWAIHSEMWELHRPMLALADEDVWETTADAYGELWVLERTYVEDDDDPSDLYESAVEAARAAVDKLRPLTED